MNDFLLLKGNHQLSCFRGCELQELIAQIESYHLEYRERLFFPSWVTFGVEIEYENARKYVVDRYITDYYSNWLSMLEGSVNKGGEVTSPILRDNVLAWEELKNICCYLKSIHASALYKAGGHIHIGSPILGSDLCKWIKFFKLYVTYEHILYRFFYGEKINARVNMKKYAAPIANRIYERFLVSQKFRNYQDIIVDLFCHFERNCAINFGNVNYSNIDFMREKNTIEVRIPNGTVEEVIWQNNVNTAVKLFLCINSSRFDEELLDYKLKQYSMQSYLYNEICLKDCLEFVDMVFDNDLDKFYFLRQYFKDLQCGYGKGNLVKSKKFIC